MDNAQRLSWLFIFDLNYISVCHTRSATISILAATYWFSTFGAAHFVLICVRKELTLMQYCIIMVQIETFMGYFKSGISKIRKKKKTIFILHKKLTWQDWDWTKYEKPTKQQNVWHGSTTKSWICGDTYHSPSWRTGENILWDWWIWL